MTIETPKIIIDDNLELDVNTGIIGNGLSKNVEIMSTFPTEEILLQIDKLDEAVSDLESSFDPNTLSRLSRQSRQGTYHMAGLLTNIVLGIVIALFFIILMI
ncbi:MAG: tetrahydromethanopterin S-methyltransferase subunit B [Methanosphaera sp. rholeuAM270]|nr:MAG: tetrahydromethanopterin S-methyltransferase subunit B [Methanosphaera sp. rholeuAM270]